MNGITRGNGKIHLCCIWEFHHSKTNRGSTNKRRDNTSKRFIAMSYSILLAPELCNRLFSIIRLLNLGHTCLFQKWFAQTYLVITNITRQHYCITRREIMDIW